MQSAKVTSKKKVEYIPPNVKAYYRMTVIETMLYWYKYRQIVQENKQRVFRNKTTHIWTTDFHKGVQVIQWSKMVFQQMMLKLLDIFMD